MFEYFKKFVKHSTIYGIGNAINRGAAFLLIPLYTRVLLPADYGMMEMYLVVAGVLRTFLGMMIAHATLRFYFEYDNEHDKKQVISTAFLFSLGISLGVIGLLIRYVDNISYLVFNSAQNSNLFYPVFGLVFFELSKEVGLAYIRAKERSLLYVALAVIQLVLQVAFNFYFVLYLHWGVAGILLGNVIGTGVSWLISTAMTFNYCGLNFHYGKLTAIAKYCFPFLLATVGNIVINNSDRIMLNSYQSLAVVGIYALALRFGIGVRDLIIESFTINFGQSRFAIMKQPDAKVIYATTLTYFFYVITFISLGIALYSKEILMIISSPDFRDAYKLVPLILISVILGGVGYILQTGILIAKKTKYMFYITIIAALMTIALNRLFIPHMSSYGAALAAVLTGLVTCVVTYLISNKLYAIKYEFVRLIKILFGSVISYGISLFAMQVLSGNLWEECAVKLLLFMSFPVLLYYAGFYTPGEKAKFRLWGGQLRKTIREKLFLGTASRPG